MKTVLSIVIVTMICMTTIAQNVAINTTGNAAHASAILDVSANGKGILIPRMASIERSNIQNPANGLLVYDLTSNSFWYFANGWQEIGGNGGFYLPYDGVHPDANKLFSVTNTSPASSTAIFGRRLAGSGIGLSTSNGVWGDNLDGNGVAGTSDSNNGVAGFSNTGIGVSATSISGPGVMAVSTTGFGISSISQMNFGLAGLSNAAEKAGVLGTNSTSSGIGYGVIGFIENPTGGAGIFGRNNAIAGNAGLFQTNNVNNQSPALDVSTAGKGPAGKFAITNPANSNAALLVNNGGFGTSLYVMSSQTGLTAPAIEVVSAGTGGGIDVSASKGKAAVFSTTEPLAPNETMIVSTVAEATNAVFNSNNPLSYVPGMIINQHGTGRGLEVNLSKPTNGSAGIRVSTEGNIGMEVFANGMQGILATAAANNGIAVQGTTGPNANNGIGVKGTTGLNATNAIGVLGAAGLSDVGGIGVKGISHANSQAIGAVTGTNMESGVGLYGEAHGTDGIGVLGSVGHTGNQSVAALFRNAYDLNLKPVVKILSNGRGNGLYFENLNSTNASAMLQMKSGGAGHFMRMDDESGNNVVNITKSGNVDTDGMVTVDDGAGIVRSTYPGQQRMELHSPFLDLDGAVAYTAGSEIDLSITFNETYDTPPAVMIGGIDINGSVDKWHTCVVDITTTGCTFRLMNNTGSTTVLSDSMITLVVIGRDNN